MPHAGSSQFPPAPALTLAPAPFTPAPAPAPSHTTPYNTSPQFHLPGLLTPKDALNNHNTDDDDFNQDISGLFDAPLGDYFEDDYMMVEETTNSPSHVAGKKRQLPSSPSPPPNAPEPFHRPAKSPASSYNNCSVFSLQKPLSCGGRCKRPSEMLWSTSTTRNTTSTSDYFVSPTPQTSLPTSAGSLKKKKAKSDVMEQVDQIKDEIQSMHSDAMSHHDSKHQRFLAKLNTKSKHNCDIKKYEWLHTNHEHEASQATVSHQRLQETKDTEICLCETDIQVHKAHSLVLKKEAETL